MSCDHGSVFFSLCFTYLFFLSLSLFLFLFFPFYFQFSYSEFFSNELNPHWLWLLSFRLVALLLFISLQFILVLFTIFVFLFFCRKKIARITWHCCWCSFSNVIVRVPYLAFYAFLAVYLSDINDTWNLYRCELKQAIFIGIYAQLTFTIFDCSFIRN